MSSVNSVSTHDPDSFGNLIAIIGDFETSYRRKKCANSQAMGTRTIYQANEIGSGVRARLDLDPVELHWIKVRILFEIML